MAKQSNLNFKLYPNRLKQSTTNGKYPIYFKLTYKGSKVEFRLLKTYDLTEDELSLWDEEFMRIGGNKHAGTNTTLNNLQSNFDKYLRANNDAIDPNHSLENIRDIILEKIQPKTNWSVKGYCDYYYNERVVPSNKIGEGTKGNHKKAIKHFTNFLTKQNLLKMPLSAFKYKNAGDFEIYMGKDAKNRPTSTSANIKWISKIFKEAIKEELIEKNPFAGLKLVYFSEDRTPNLTINQVKQILECEEITADDDLVFYRDLFLFGCFTGMAVSNIMSLTNECLFPLSDNKIKLDTQRVKTGELTVQVLTTAAKRIIEKYAGISFGNKARVLPKFDAGTFNERLKVIGAHARINIILTTKISRTTCNQMLINVGGFNMIYERTFMGWSNLSDIQSVYTRLEDEVLVRNTDNIDKYLFKHLGEDLLKKIDNE